MVDTVMPPADWRRLYQGVTERLAGGALAVLAVTPFVDDELPLYVTRNAAGLATGIFDTPPPPGAPTLVTGGVYGLSPEARRLADVAVASLHRMRAFLRLLVELRAPVATVEVPRIIDLDHKRDLDAAERWLTARAGDEQLSVWLPSIAIPRTRRRSTAATTRRSSMTRSRPWSSAGGR